MDIFGRGPVHHTPADARATEPTNASATLARGTGKPKGYPVATAWGQHHVGEDGTGQTGISRTESAAALTGYKLPTDPAVQHGSKKLPVPACNTGTPSRPERGNYKPAIADALTGEATRAKDDFAPILHTLPSNVTEE
jgi:hypothetical protein